MRIGMFINFPATIDRRNASGLLVTISVLTVIVGGAVLRLHGLDRTSVWNDEAASWSMARLPFWDMIRATITDEHPPLYNLILYVAIRLLGDSETALRLPSALMGIANICLVYWLGTALWDRLTGAFAAALLAFAGFHIWFSQEARMYSLLCLAATAFALATVLFLGKPSRYKAVLCSLAGMTLLYSHIYGALDWAAINLVVGAALIRGSTLKGASRRMWFASQSLAALSYLPSAFLLAGRARLVMNDFWIPFPTIHFLYWNLRALAGGTAMLGALFLLVLVALFVSEGGRALAVQSSEPSQPSLRTVLANRWRMWLLLGWGALPFLVGYTLSVVKQPIILDRYLIGSLPPVLLLAARGLWILRSNRVVLAAAVAAIVACSGPAVYRSIAVNTREDGRAAVATFAARFKNSDAVVFSSPGVANIFAYYFRRSLALKSVAYVRDSDPIKWPCVARVWVFAREGIEAQTAPVLSRIAAVYQQQQVFLSYNFRLYLYGLRQSSGTTPPQIVDAQSTASLAGTEEPRPLTRPAGAGGPNEAVSAVQAEDGRGACPGDG